MKSAHVFRFLIVPRLELPFLQADASDRPAAKALAIRAHSVQNDERDGDLALE